MCDRGHRVLKDLRLRTDPIDIFLINTSNFHLSMAVLGTSQLTGDEPSPLREEDYFGVCSDTVV